MRKPETKTKTEHRLLPCILSEIERTAFGRENARAIKEQFEMQEEKKAVAADFTARLKLQSAHIANLSEKVDTGIEYRSIECRWEFDRYDGRARLLRPDTGEVIASRLMTADEMQTEMDLE